VGRDGELRELRRAYRSLVSGESCILELHGQPGIGKSTLLGRFAREVRDEGDVLVLAGRCHEREAVPFKAVDGVVDALALYLRSLPRSEAAALMPREAHLLAQVFPELATVAAVRDVPRRPAVEDARERRRRAFAALKELLARLSDKRPLVVTIDDLQWGDCDSAPLLAELVSWPEPPRMLLVASYRTGDVETSVALRSILEVLRAAAVPRRELALDPLPTEEAMVLARQLLEDANDDVLRDLVDRGQGHPLFLAELARELPLVDGATVETPSLADLLWRRVRRLPGDVRALLETMAVSGEPIGQALCFEAAGLGAGGGDALRVLRAEHLARGTDEGVVDVFHDRIREAILGQVDASTRRMRHLTLARTMEERDDRDAEALARHFDAADEHARAGHYAAIAGDAALDNLAFDRAAGLYRMSVERLAPDGEGLYVKLADALLHAGSTAAAGRAYIAAADHAEGARAIDLKRRGAEHLLRMGDAEMGLAVALETLDAVGQKVPASPRRGTWELLYHTLRMRLSGFQCELVDPSTVDRHRLLELDVLRSASYGLEFVDITTAIALGARYCRLALDVGEPSRAVRGMAQATLGLLGEQRARPALVDEVLDRAAALAQEIDDPASLVEVRLIRARSHHYCGQWAEAVALYDESLAMIEERCPGLATEQRLTQWHRAYAAAKCGRFVDAQVGRRWLMDALDRQDPVSEKAVCLTTLVAERLAAGDLDQARDDAHRGDALETRCALELLQAEAQGAVAMYSGQPGEAARLWERAWPTLRSTKMLVLPGFRVVAARASAMALIAMGDRRALDMAKRLGRGLKRMRMDYAIAARASIEAGVHWGKGDEERAAAEMADAAEHYAAAQMAIDAATCRHRLGQLRGGDEGTAMMNEAIETLRRHGIAEPERWMAMQLPAPH
jgi:tetratricopeptide (TPR) repeat protein